MHDDKEYAYSPYGSLSEGIIDGFNEYGYKGEVHDNQSLQYLRARYYHTKLTQFISIDTYQGSERNPLSQNRYSFASNNPYKYSDPSGHFITSIAGDKVYIAGTAASKIASANNTKTPTVDKPLTENQVNDIIDSYNPGPSNTNVAWRLLVQEKLQADYLAQQQAIEDAIPKGAKIVHEEFNRTVTQEAYDNYLEQVKQSTETNDEGILSKIGNFVTGFVKAYVNVDAFKDLATSTWDFFSNPQENFNWKSLGNYLDSNLQNIALVAGTIGAAALSLSALPFLAAGGAMLGTIATYAGLTMGIAGGVQIASGLAGYSLAGDKLSTTDRLYRVMSGGFNVLGGNSLLKGGLKLTQNNSKILTGITNTIDSVVAKTVSTAKDIGRRAVSTLKTGITNVYTGAKNLAVSGIRKANSYISAGYNKVKDYIIEKADKVYKTVFNKDKKNIFGDLSEAAIYGVKPFSVLQKELKETALEAHHIVEKRLAEALGIRNTRSMLSVAVTKAEHQVFTNKWRSILPYGSIYRDLSSNEIWEYAQDVYQGYPALLDAAKISIFK